MKKFLFTVVFVFVCSWIFPQQQYTVAVTPFELVGGFTQGDADVIYELFVTELGRTTGITVVDRNSFDRIQAEMDFQLRDFSDKNKVVEFGRALNANCFIRGQLMTLAGRLIISARVVDVNTTEILSAAPMQLNDISEVFDSLPSYVVEVVKQISIPVTPPPPQPYNPAVSGYRIGDKGPGGGTVFFAQGGQYMEYSGNLGRGNWKEARRIAGNHRGGGFNNWHLPTRREIQLIGLRNVNDYYWTSEESGAGLGNAWLYTGGTSFLKRDKDQLRNFFAVRSFSR